jgi:hypothetical protein
MSATSITVLTESGLTTLLLSEISAVTVMSHLRNHEISISNLTGTAKKETLQVHLKSGTIFTVIVKEDYVKLYEAWMRFLE